MQPLLLRARTSGEILDAAFQLLRVHYSALVLATGVFLLPPILLAWFVPSLTVVANLLNNLLTLAAGAVVSVIVSDIYLGYDVDIGASIRAVGRRFGSVWGAAIIQGFVILFGLILLIVPGIIYFAWSFAMPAIVMIEGVGASRAWERSKELAKGSVWHILAAVGVAWIITIIVGLGVIFSAALVIEAAGIGEAIIDPLSGIVMALVFPFVGVVTTLLYYDLRIRKEGFDLQLLANAIGQDAPPAPHFA